MSPGKPALRKNDTPIGVRAVLAHCETFTDPWEIRMASAMHYLKVRGERPWKGE